LNIGASVGVTMVPAAGATVAEVLACADTACYTAKRAGRNSVHVHAARVAAAPQPAAAPTLQQA